MSDTLAGMRKAQEYLDGKRTRGEDSIIRDLLSAVERVLELHVPFEWSFGYGPVKSCKECARLGADEAKAQYPCPTVQTIQEALGGVNHD